MSPKVFLFSLGLVLFPGALRAPEPVAPTSKPLALFWECPGWRTQGGAMTGIESTTNFQTWTREFSTPLAGLSNRWTDLDTSGPQKFYRAFIE